MTNIKRQSGSVIDVVGGVTLDSILRADGSWVTDKLGGNGLWAAAGVLLAGGQPRLRAAVGNGYPTWALEQIANTGIQAQEVVRRNMPTPRVTFAYRPDGSREQPASPERVTTLPTAVQEKFADTTRDAQIRFGSIPQAAELGAADSGSWHIGLVPVQRFVDLISALGDTGYVQADCPARFEVDLSKSECLMASLERLDVFLPSTSDADVFAPGVDPIEVIGTFHRLGARTIVLKAGGRGAVLSAGRRQWAIPAFPTEVASDPTGAGDVFCGAFAHSISVGASHLEAAIMASTCASYALVVDSPLDLAAMAAPDLNDRFDHIYQGVEEL